MVFDSNDIQAKWLDERFEHINTMLAHVRDSVDKVREDQSRCINRCDYEMNAFNTRLREIERLQDEMAGAGRNKVECRDRQSLTWQMVMAIGAVFSAMAAVITYVVGRV